MPQGTPYQNNPYMGYGYRPKDRKIAQGAGTGAMFPQFIAPPSAAPVDQLGQELRTVSPGASPQRGNSPARAIQAPGQLKNPPAPSQPAQQDKTPAPATNSDRVKGFTGGLG